MNHPAESIDIMKVRVLHTFVQYGHELTDSMAESLKA
jgi:hypothetical protein